MASQKIIFLGSKPIGYTCLEYLIQQSQTLDINIIAVLSNDNTLFDETKSVKALAQQHNIPIIDNIDDIPECDIMYSVQYHQILKPQHLQRAKTIAVNLHMAPLPDYRGCNQFSFAILDDKEVFGTTIHVMDSKIDHGDILFEKRFTIKENCWVEELYEQTFEISSKLFRDTLANIMKGDYTRMPQEALLELRDTQLHFRKEINDIKQIDLDWEKSKIEKHIRATYMPGFEPPYTFIDGQKVYFTKACL